MDHTMVFLVGDYPFEGECYNASQWNIDYPFNETVAPQFYVYDTIVLLPTAYKCDVKFIELLQSRGARGEMNDTSSIINLFTDMFESEQKQHVELHKSSQMQCAQCNL